MEAPQTPLPATFYQRSPEVVARQLLGKAIVRRIQDILVGGLIVETEAYKSKDDPASHSHRGIGKRNKSMFAEAGTLYVYTIHAKHCLNAVTEKEGVGSAVLVRAVEPIWAIKRMRENRGKDDIRQLCRGPAMLCQALEVNLTLDGLDLCAGRQIWISDVGVKITSKIRAGSRIGISQGQDLPLRFFVAGNRFVSGRAKEHGIPVKSSLHQQ